MFLINFLNIRAIFILDFFFSLVGVLLRVAFFTLVERKFIGLYHYRKGPRKSLIFGLLQPVVDALKLLTKESLKIVSYKILIYFFGPLTSIIIMFFIWYFYFYTFNLSSSSLRFFVILALLSLIAYGFLIIRWGSNSKYSLLGGHRVLAQVISYEVCLVLFILIPVYFRLGYRFGLIMSVQNLL